MVQASSYPDTLRFRFPLFPSYYGNWQIYVTNEIFCLKPLIPCLLLPPILLLSTTNSARLRKGAVQRGPLLTGSMAGINPCCKDITHQEGNPHSQILMLPQASNSSLQAFGKAQCPTQALAQRAHPCLVLNGILFAQF